MKITVLAIGKARGVEAEWGAEYQKRLGDSLEVRELVVPKSLPPAEAKLAESQLLLKAIPLKSFVVLMDEKGKNLSSRELAGKISELQDRGLNSLVFVIGGAGGVNSEVRLRASFTLAFGQMTWPHQLARVMLLEQIYRAKQIIAGHPYHKD